MLKSLRTDLSDETQFRILIGSPSSLIATFNSTGLVMNDKSISGVDNITFTDTAGAIAGIQNANLLDKTASETISAHWTYTAGGLGQPCVTLSTTPSSGVGYYMHFYDGAVYKGGFLSYAGVPTLLGNGSFSLASSLSQNIYLDGNDINYETPLEHNFSVNTILQATFDSNGLTMLNDLDLNGNQLFLDADRDSYFAIPSDDKLDLWLGGVSEVRWEADKQTFNNGAADTGFDWGTSGLLKVFAGSVTHNFVKDEGLFHGAVLYERETISATTANADGTKLLHSMSNTSGCTLTLLTNDIRKDGKLFVFKDIGYNAGTNPHTIVGQSSETFDGAGNYQITTNGGWAVFVSDGNNLFQIG